jgi:hypothetical protein
MQYIVRNSLEGSLAPNLQIPQRIFQLFGDSLFYDKVLLLFFGDLRKHE